MSERRGMTQLAGRNPSLRLSPLPTGTGSTLQPFPQIRDSHRINVDADILGEQTREGLQALALQILVSVFRRSNHQGKAHNETHRRLRMPVYESRHVIVRCPYCVLGDNFMEMVANLDGPRPISSAISRVGTRSSPIP
jgi:hypothetical protein